MSHVLLVVMLTALGQATPTTSERTAVLSPVHQFIDSLNKGDLTAAVAACAAETEIIDEFPPIRMARRRRLQEVG